MLVNEYSAPSLGSDGFRACSGAVTSKAESDPWDSDCPYMMDGGTNWSEAQAARDIVTKLNTKIQEKVNDVRAMNVDNLRLHFVDANGVNSPFTGYEVCGTESTSYFQNIDQATQDAAYVFHPNALGQQAYADLIASAINTE